jgi:outer membrane PBP1 activator LpoA protein
MRSVFKKPCLGACYLFVTLFVLTACGTGPTKPDSKATQVTQYDMDQVPVLLEKANQAAPAERAPLLLDAVEILLANGEFDWARNIITGLTPANLPNNRYARYQLLASQLSAETGSQFAAQRQLTTERLESLLPELPLDLAIALHEQRAQVFANIGDYRASVEERVQLSELMALSADVIEEERDLNHDILWQTLMQLSYQDLNELKQTAENHVLEGWYSLASLSKSHQTNLNKQFAKVSEWMQEWPHHPASLRLPADLQLLRDLVENQPTKIALLLPLTGKLEQASVAIRDGFMAGYYDAAQSREPLPDIRIYDTSALGAARAYDQALLDGAQMVVGPLEKESIAELALRLDMPVPTLALNYVDTPIAEHQKLYQFGLAVEDEAEQVAQQAWRDGHRRALIFAPNSTWGDRSVDTFWQEWQSQGGEITRDYRFNGTGDYLGVVGSALHISESKERAQHMRRILGRSVEFEPRRRQDVDMIFLAANSQEARQLKPTLAFHYAGGIPVYATSQVYSGDDPKANQDMNGVRFTVLPWFFNEDSPERKVLNRYGNPAVSYQRLYALGVDAFHLYPRLRQLKEVTGARYYGHTGALSLDGSNKVERQQAWAQFVRGKLQVMPTLSEDDEG